MKQLAVTSKIIKSVYFSPNDGQLRICFKNGEERNFRDVPEAEVNAMCAAPSPGQHYISNISRQYPRIAA
ncbi:hypothetical protein D3C87_1717010 [compost metagenome]